MQLNGTINQKLEHLPTGPVSAFVGMASGQASISYSDGAVTITSSGGVIAWAALYEGTYTEQTMPEYHPKGYGIEFAECWRYYRRYTSSYASLVLNGLVTGSTKDIMITQPDSRPMRIKSPTVSYTGKVTIRGVNGYATEAGSGDAAYETPRFALYCNDASFLPVLKLTKSDGTAWGLTNNTVVSVQFYAGYLLEISADL